MFFKVLSAGTVSLYVTKFELNDAGVSQEIHEYCYMFEKGDGQFKILEAKGLKNNWKIYLNRIKSYFKNKRSKGNIFKWGIDGIFI